MSDTICPFCGAYSPRSCELEEETGGACPWIESGEYKEEPDPDRMREDLYDRRRLDEDDTQEADNAE